MSSVVRGAVVGAVLGAALTVLTAVTDPFGHPSRIADLIEQVPTEPRANDPVEVGLLLDAWLRWRSLPVTVTSTSTRTVDGVPVLSGIDVLAQRPPEEVHSTGGEVVAVLGGERFVCSDAVTGTATCTSSGAFDRDALVAAEVAGFRQRLDGDRPEYHLDRRDGCFILRRQRSVVAPPLRDVATYCFDDDGVLTSAELRDEVAMDRLEMVEVRPVTDADLALPG